MTDGRRQEVSRETSLLRDLADYLAGPGLERGLIGPREADRLWDRHILNCAVVAWDVDLVPQAASVVDVGSGAGLPGIVWALVRPDLTITLVESLQRRVTFLGELVDRYGLADRVEVRRTRAEDVRSAGWSIATARAVAALPRLLPWLAPLVHTGGSVLAFKGRNAPSEIEAAAGTAARLRLAPAELHTVGQGTVDPPTTIVRYLRRPV